MEKKHVLTIQVTDTLLKQAITKNKLFYTFQTIFQFFNKIFERTANKKANSPVQLYRKKL